MDINLFDYDLPDKQIAQFPTEKRDESRLLVIDRSRQSIDHKYFYDILDYFSPGDCLVMNNSKVIHARLIGTKQSTGATIEIFLVKKPEDGNDIWEVMIKPAKRLKIGDIVNFSDSFRAEMVRPPENREESTESGMRFVKFNYEGIFTERLAELGKMPLPPYIKREADVNDENRYQTVYSEIEGSVAAPTAGLHFTEEILDKATDKGIKIAFLTLHVGIGTFLPVKVKDTDDHVMHREIYTVSEETADIINTSRKSGGKIICVGTTSVRTIESVSDDDGIIHPGSGETGIFISPGYRFKAVDALITNFHLPKSTLLMLVSAFYEREKILGIYKTAIDNEYRFFSYGDAMLIL